MGMANLRDWKSGARTNPGCRLAEAGMMNRLLKRLFSADAFGLLLIVMALQTLTYGISSSVRGTDTPRLFIVCLVAALLAYGMSRSGFSGTEASVVAGVVGVLGIWIVTARL